MQHRPSKKCIYTDLILELQKQVGQAKERKLLQILTIFCGLEETMTNIEKGFQ